MNEIITNIIGYAAAVVGTSMMIPQVIKFVRTKRADDVSLFATILYFLNCVLWFAYGILIVAYPVILANGIALVISVVQLVLKKRYSGVGT